MTVRNGPTERRALVLGAVGICVVFVGSIALIHAVTGAPPAGPPAPVREAGVVASPDVAPPAPPSVGRPGGEVAARAPHAAPVTRPPADSPEARPTASVVRPPGGIKISFKLDPRITKSLHMGTRWVSPPTYVGKHEGDLFTVQARADGATAGRAIRDPTWSPAEPDMVAVTPDRGREVEISVLREGRSTLTVAEGDAGRTVTVNAVQRDGVWQVDISQ
jgi:hypothetical protein